MCRVLSFHLSFFFYCSADHRDLHSFPTRRSSDLTKPSIRSVHLTMTTRRSGGAVFSRAAFARFAALAFFSTSFGSRRSRSEEHTSELQSQSNLVCRLLLEKKKICNFRFRVQRFR